MADWGHGPNNPVRTYTEDEILEVLATSWPWSDFVDRQQIIDALREHREAGTQEAST